MPLAELTHLSHLDPGVLLYLLRKGLDIEHVDQLVNEQGGLLGLSGISSDMKDLLDQEQEARAQPSHRNLLLKEPQYG